MKVPVLEPLTEPTKMRIEMPETWRESRVAVLGRAQTAGAEGVSDHISLRVSKEVGKEVRGLVLRWAGAWSEQDVESYLACYALDFRPDGGLGRAAWEAQRRERLSRPEFIRVEVDFLAEPQQISPGRYRVMIRQVYEADHYSDTVRKALDFVQEGQGWKILREEQLAVL